MTVGGTNGRIRDGAAAVPRSRPDVGERFLASSPHPVGAKVLPVVVTGLLLCGLLPLAFTSEIGMIAAVVIAVFLVVLFTFGMVKTATGIIAVGFVLAPLNDVRPVPAVAFVTASDAMFAVGFGLLMPTLIGARFRPPAPFVVGVSVVVFTGLLASLVGGEPFLSLNHMLRLVVGAFGLPILIMLWRPTRDLVVLLAWAYLVGNVVNVVAAVLKGAEIAGNRYQGLSTHVNIFGLCALLAISLIPFLFAISGPPQRLLLVGMAGVCGYGIWISGSRAALLVAVAVALIYPILARSVEAAIGLFGLAVVGIAVVGQSLEKGAGDNALGRLLGGGSASGSDDARERAAAVAIDQFQQNPILGGGFGKVLEAHNIYLQIAASVGIIGLVGYLILIYSVVSPSFLARQPYHLLAFPALAYAMIGMITPLLWDRYIWCVLALAFTAVTLDRTEEPARQSSPNLHEERT